MKAIMMVAMKNLLSILALVSFFLLLSSPTRAFGPTRSAQPKSYALRTWSNPGCGAKGRFQDRDYCASAVMDQIVRDGKSAIPVLISQITDSHWIAEPVFDYWPRIRTGELAYFILKDLFLDDTWQKRTMPALFTVQRCDEPAWNCWLNFRKNHTLKELQAQWLTFWAANQDTIYWDEKARCFRLSNFDGSSPTLW